ITAPSTTSVLPTNAQVSEQLQLISRQAKLLDAGETSGAAVAKIKDAFNKVEDLSRATTLTAEQQVALQDMKAAITRIDQASVEANGLRTLEAKSAQIGAQSSRVEAVAGNISRSLDLTSTAATDAQIEQKLNAITRAAQDARAARTLEEQV